MTDQFIMATILFACFMFTNLNSGNLFIKVVSYLGILVTLSTMVFELIEAYARQL